MLILNSFTSIVGILFFNINIWECNDLVRLENLIPPPLFQLKELDATLDAVTKIKKYVDLPDTDLKKDILLVKEKSFAF